MSSDNLSFEIVKSIVGGIVGVASAVTATLIHSKAIKQRERYISFSRSVSKLENVCVRTLDLIRQNLQRVISAKEVHTSRQNIVLWDQFFLVDAISIENLIDEFPDTTSRNVLYGLSYYLTILNEYSRTLNMSYESMRSSLIEGKIGAEAYNARVQEFLKELANYQTGLRSGVDKIHACLALVELHQPYFSKRHGYSWFIFRKFDPIHFSESDVIAILSKIEVSYKAKRAIT